MQRRGSGGRQPRNVLLRVRRGDEVLQLELQDRAQLVAEKVRKLLIGVHNGAVSVDHHHGLGDIPQGVKIDGK